MGETWPGVHFVAEWWMAWVGNRFQRIHSSLTVRTAYWLHPQTHIETNTYQAILTRLKHMQRIGKHTHTNKKMQRRNVWKKGNCSALYLCIVITAPRKVPNRNDTPFDSLPHLHVTSVFCWGAIEDHPKTTMSKSVTFQGLQQNRFRSTNARMPHSWQTVQIVWSGVVGLADTDVAEKEWTYSTWACHATRNAATNQKSNAHSNASEFHVSMNCQCAI